MEHAVSIALGKVDSLDVLTIDTDATWKNGLPLWYRYLNCGFTIPATAGTDKMWGWIAVGANRTYAHLDKEFTYQSWLEALKKGRSFISNCPMIFFNIGEHQIGDRVDLKKAGKKYTVTVEAVSQVPFDKLEIVRNGEVIWSFDTQGDKKKAHLEREIAIDKSCWIAARCYGTQFAGEFYGRRTGIFAHTNPIYFNVNGAKIASVQDARYFVEYIDKAIEWIDTKGRYETEAQKQEVLELFKKGRQVYQNMLSTPGP